MCGIVALTTVKDYQSSADLELTEKNVTNWLDYVTKIKSSRGLLTLRENESLLKALAEKLLYEKNLANSESRNNELARVQSTDTLTEALWIIENDIPAIIGCINTASSWYVDRNAEDSSAIFKFYHMVELVLRSIDARMETRGRDSLGIGIVFACSADPKLSVTSSPDAQRDVLCGEAAEGWYASFVYKVAKETGELGHNGAELRRLMRQDHELQKFLSGVNYSTFSVSTHTRWASVGEVSILNCHPVGHFELPRI